MIGANKLVKMSNNHFFIVRHGESENNLLCIDSSKLENKNQFGLTKKGRKEMQLQAQKFNNFDFIITSPFRRAKESAQIFSKTSKCEVIENVLLREVYFGDFELCKYELSDEFFEKHKDESVPFPNGESLLDAKKRAIKFIKEINQIYQNKKILIVTHGWIALFLQEQLDDNFNLQQVVNDYDDNNSREVIEIKN